MVISYWLLEKKDVIGTHKGQKHVGAAFSRDKRDWINTDIEQLITNN